MDLRVGIVLGLALLPGCATSDLPRCDDPRDAIARLSPPPPDPPTNVAAVVIAPPVNPRADYAPAPSPYAPVNGRPQSISMGFIGDAPVGRYPTVHHRQPAWSRPFPGSWTSGYHAPIRRR
jgi:hypothetical protein